MVINTCGVCLRVTTNHATHDRKWYLYLCLCVSYWWIAVLSNVLCQCRVNSIVWRRCLRFGSVRMPTGVLWTFSEEVCHQRFWYLLVGIHVAIRRPFQSLWFRWAGGAVSSWQTWWWWQRILKYDLSRSGGRDIRPPPPPTMKYKIWE